MPLGVQPLRVTSEISCAGVWKGHNLTAPVLGYLAQIQCLSLGDFDMNGVSDDPLCCLPVDLVPAAAWW